VETIESDVMDCPRRAVLERRIAIPPRCEQHAVHCVHLGHVPHSIVGKGLSPYLRDVHDDLDIILDLIAGDRDRLAAVLDIYLSNVANRTTEATKTLNRTPLFARPRHLVYP
jgi:Mg2+ and Co2+ transporter CorA